MPFDSVNAPAPTQPDIIVNAVDENDPASNDGNKFLMKFKKVSLFPTCKQWN